MTICVSKREGYRAGGREIPKIVKKNIVCGKERDKRERERVKEGDKERDKERQRGGETERKIDR